MRKLLIATAILAAAFVAGCTNVDRTESTLLDAGIRPINVGGYAWFACSEDDTFATKFVGTNREGRTVQGAVCLGLFKGATIRFD